MSLRARLISIISVLLMGVTLLMSSYFIREQQQSLAVSLAAQNQQLREDLESKGMTLVRNVSFAAQTALVEQNYLFLTDVIRNTVGHDPEIVYGIIMAPDGVALVHSDDSAAGVELTTDADKFALGQSVVATQEVSYKGRAVLEALAPISVGDRRFGTMRFGLSLHKLNDAIATGHEAMRATLRQQFLASILASLLLGLVGCALGAMAAGYIVRPLGGLLQGVQRMMEGDRDYVVTVSGSPEFTMLANSFNRMTGKVKGREEELERAREVAEEANRMKGEFLANISHELRTPLNAIVNLPEILLRDFKETALLACEGCGATFNPGDDEQFDESNRVAMPCDDCGKVVHVHKRVFFTGEGGEHARLLRRSMTAAQHLLQVVNDLLDFSKLEAGKMELNFGDVNPQDMLQEIVETMAKLADKKGLELSVDERSESFALRGDGVKLSQVLLNLVSNAIKFCDTGGVTVGCVVRGARARFDVRDTGPGIPEDKLRLLFERFSQIDGSHTRKHGGTGLGLAISKQLVALHGGTIGVESVVGKGSTFYFEVPLEPAVAAPEVLHFTGRVLIVDDNEGELDVVGEVLSRAGFTPVLVSRPEQLWESVRDERPDCIILDLMMPGISGLRLLRELKSADATKSIPVFIATAYHTNREVVRALGGMWLPKPWSNAELVATLRSHGIGSARTSEEENT